MQEALVKEDQKVRGRVHFRLHPKKDEDIIQFLEGKNITDTIKELVREKIKMDKFGVPFVPSPSFVPPPFYGNHFVERSPMAPKIMPIPKKKENPIVSSQHFIKETETKESSAVDLF